MTELSASRITEEDIAAFRVKLMTWVEGLTEQERRIVDAIADAVRPATAPDDDVRGYENFQLHRVTPEQPIIAAILALVPAVYQLMVETQQKQKEQGPTRRRTSGWPP